MKSRNLIAYRKGRYVLPGHGSIPFRDEEALNVLIQDIEQVDLVNGIIISYETAKTLAKKAMLQRSQDFAASAMSYRLACRVQWRAGRHA